MDMFPDNWPNKVEEMRSPQRRQPPCTTSHNLLHRRLGFPRIRIPDLVRRQTYGARKHCGQCLWQLHDPLHIGKNHSARSCVCMVELLRRSDSRPGIPLFYDSLAPYWTSFFLHPRLLRETSLLDVWCQNRNPSEPYEPNISQKKDFWEITVMQQNKKEKPPEKWRK